ncbi:recombinase family protein [Lacrimispora sp.]|uniref:recombinase family protein n=1 Tax=Lacrimispora sp. TaxID=2719234 RepID=UPI00346088DA
MARIRKTPDKAEKDRTLWKAALYIRLSREDGNDESYSVQNQKQRLKEYLENLSSGEEVQLADIYIDDGCTGTDSNRESFQNMLEDIDKGFVNCVIVKDLSRLSRNDWECKKYLQHLFVIKNVRFISLELPRLDSYKNPDEVYEMGVSIQSMYNENHCRETSVKVRGTFNMKRKKGEFIGAFAPYGYLKDPDDKHRLLVDKDAAPVIQDIFHWFVRDGMSKNGIVRKLISLGIPCPSAYKRQKGMKYHNPSIASHEPLWSARSITAILTNQMYLGHMVQGRQKVRSYKVHTRINVPENQWFIVENTHEAIIDKETFDKARELMQRDTRTVNRSGHLYTFSGFLRCADCGKAMGHRTSKNISYYACRTNTSQGLCTRHSIRHDKLEAMVLEVLQKHISLIDDLDRLMEDINNTPASRTVSKGAAPFIKLRKQELKRISSLRTGLYADWKNGDITREEYHCMKEEFGEKEKKLKQEIESLEKEYQNMTLAESFDAPYLTAFFKHKNICSLNRGIVAELVKVIYIHEGGDITIHFNFTDQHQPMAEFIEKLCPALS